MRLPIWLPATGALVALTVAVAQPASAQVSGTFAIVHNQNCVVVEAPATFNSSNQATAGPVFNVAVHSAGTITFNSNGTGGASSDEIVSTSTPVPPGSSFSSTDSNASTSSSSFNFTYTVTGSLIYISLTSGSYNETITAGPRAGQTATLDKIALIAYVSADGNHFLAINNGNEIGTKTFSNGDVRPSICTGSFDGFKYP